jgi:1-acyl-sn-glycerol-3-phosphate acyltransferase
MPGKSGTARLAHQAALPITPVGLWGTHRILYKGRKPAPRWGVGQTAVIGKPIELRSGEHIKDGTRRIMAAIAECVARAREIYPQRPGAGEDAWWWRDPSTAGAHGGSA